MNYNLITILGPTAAGKTRLAAKLAYEFDGEIISADSRQVYKDMNIGTGKDLEDYIVAGTAIPYHLIDIISPKDEFDVFAFTTGFFKAFEEIRVKEKTPFLAGGTGLYLSSVIQNYELKKAEFSREDITLLESKSQDELRKYLLELKPVLHNTTDLITKERIIKAILLAKAPAVRPEKNTTVINSLNLGIMPERPLINKRITERLKARLHSGMIREVEKLLAAGISFEKLDYFGLEYKYAARYIKGEMNYNDMFQKLNSSIHKFAKRQATWFRKMEREGVKIHWLDNPDFAKAKEIIKLNYFHEN